MKKIMFCLILPFAALVFLSRSFVAFAQSAAPTLQFKNITSADNPLDVAVQVLVSAPTPANAYDVSITYPENLLQFKNISRGNSIIDIWQSGFTQPDNGEISIQGGSFHPFQGSDGLLGTLHFRLRTSGMGFVSFDKTNIALADGKGTMVQANAPPLLLEFAYPTSAASPMETTTSMASAEEVPVAGAITQNPLDPSTDLLVISGADANVKAVYVQTRSGLVWGDLFAAQNVFPIAKDVWEVKIYTMYQNGAADEQVIYRWNVLFASAWPYMSGALLLIIAMVFGLVRRRAKKRMV